MMLLIYALLAGLWLGLTLHWSRLTQPVELRRALALRASTALHTVLGFLGWGAIMVSFLSWLAVLDVDLLAVSALHGGVLIGGVIAGLGAALSGRTPLTALGGIGSAGFLESLCTVIGCALGALLLPLLGDVIQPLLSLPPHLEGTLFRVTLDEAFLFQGGFLGQGCLGAVLLALALWIPLPKQEEEPVTESHVIIEPPDEESEDNSTEGIPDPESAPEETLILSLEGEEPLVLDTESEDAEEDLSDLPEIEDEPLEDEQESPEDPDTTPDTASSDESTDQDE